MSGVSMVESEEMTVLVKLETASQQGTRNSYTYSIH